MKKIMKTALLAASAALVSHAAQAGDFTADDLYLGFTYSSAPADYIIDLGQGSTLLNATSVVNLSGDISMSTFNSLFTSGAPGVSMGVVGGNATYPASGNDIYATELRSGGAGVASVPGSPNLFGPTTLSFPNNGTELGLGASAVNRMAPDLPVGAGGNFVSSNKVFTAYIVPSANETAQTLPGATSINAMGTIDNSGVLYEDLWHATTSSQTYLGYLTLNLGGSSPSLTFTPQAVPEPTVLTLLGGASLLLLTLRRRLSGKSA